MTDIVVGVLLLLVGHYTASFSRARQAGMSQLWLLLP